MEREREREREIWRRERDREIKGKKDDKQLSLNHRPMLNCVFGPIICITESSQLKRANNNNRHIGIQLEYYLNVLLYI